MTERSVNAVILAGSRPGGDAFTAAHGLEIKALVPVDGQPMVNHVIETLSAAPNIGAVQILAQTDAALQDVVKAEALRKVSFVESRSTIASSLEALLDRPDATYPLLITTADNVLLDQAMINHFNAHALGADIAIAVVEKKILLNSYPQSKRTWLKFRAGHYSGANLFYFGSANARVILRYWADVEQDRKKGWKILSIFGPWLLFLTLIRKITIDQLATRIGKKLDLKVVIVEMPQAEACIDVDKEADLVLVEKILEARR